MAISGKQNINIGLPNQAAGSDSLRDAFTKIENNFGTLFGNASPYNTFNAGNGIQVNTNSNTGLVEITNSGVTSLTAGSGITINQSNGDITISSTGGNGGGLNSVGLVPVSSARLTVTNSPLVTDGNLGIDLALSGANAGTYTFPTLTIDGYGRVTNISNNTSVGTVTSVGISGGSGITVTGSPITSAGNITVTNTGVTRITAGAGISVSGSNGNVTISSVTSGGTVTSVNIASNNLLVTGGPISTAGTINVNLPNNLSILGNISTGNIVSAGTLNVSGNASTPNLSVTSNLTVTGNSNLSLLLANAANIVSLITSNVTNTIGNIRFSANSVSNVATIAPTGLYVSGEVVSDGNITAPYFIGNIVGNITGNFTVLGNNTEVLFNDNGFANASSQFTFDKDTGLMTAANITSSSNLTVNNTIFTSNISTDNLISNNTTTTSLTVTGDGIVNGNLTVSGNVVYVNSQSVNVEDPIIQLGRNANDSPLTIDDGKDRGIALWYFLPFLSGNVEQTAFMGYDSSSEKMLIASNVTLYGNETVTVNSYGSIVLGDIEGSNSVTANYFVGNGSSLFDILGVNVSGEVANAAYSNIAGIAYSVDAANVSGEVANASYANIAGIAYSVDAANISGEVANASYANIAGIAYSVDGGNVSGQVSNSLVSGTVFENAQPNITSVGNLISLTVTGNISGSNIIASGDIYVTTGNIIYTPIYGSFYSNVNQTNPIANTAMAMTLNNTYNASGISIVGNSQITVNKTGVYNIQFSAQCTKTDPGVDYLDIWLSKNGSSIPWTNTRVKLDGSGAIEIAAWNFVETLNANEYVEIMWASSDTDVLLSAIDAANTVANVDVPSLILTITPVGA
jgi:hypothetical protein